MEISEQRIIVIRDKMALFIKLLPKSIKILDVYSLNHLPIKQKLQRLQGKPERSLALLHGFKGVLSITDRRRGQEIPETMPLLNNTISLLESDDTTIQQQPG